MQSWEKSVLTRTFYISKHCHQSVRAKTLFTPISLTLNSFTEINYKNRTALNLGRHCKMHTTRGFNYIDTFYILINSLKTPSITSWKTPFPHGTLTAIEGHYYIMVYSLSQLHPMLLIWIRTYVLNRLKSCTPFVRYLRWGEPPAIVLARN